MQTGYKVDVLDHGYIEFIESWGSDERIIEAARMSTGKGFLGLGPVACDICAGFGEYAGPSTGITGHEDSLLTCKRCHGSGKVAGDEKLLAYLHNNKHHTPFEMAGMVIEVQAPIMVFREWHRHRTQSYNEMSARYIPLPDMNYRPTVDRCLVVNSTNKQAGAAKDSATLTHESVLAWLSELDLVYTHAEQVYQDGLARGIPKELARLPVPVGRYSRMRASANLLNWLKFLTLRMDAKAQYEIRVYANEVGKLISQAFPRTWELFRGSVNAS